LLERLREVLAQEGLCESRSAEEEGIFFTIEGRDEVSLQYIEIEREEVPLGSVPSQRAKEDVLRCCSILIDRGYSLTLILSPRTLTLSVRYEGRPHSQDSTSATR
jgi:hypothetical protein